MSASRSNLARALLAAITVALASVLLVASARSAEAWRAPARDGVSARVAATAPTLRTMIVGRGNAILSPARTVVASAATVRVGARDCAVAAATPLAVLAAVRRDGGPGFALRDYGRCGASSASSAALFVYALGGERNSGQSGWEYKVDGVSGSAGAADPSGPQGDGHRLRSGQQVLWFWCNAHAAGCQRTLELSSSQGTVAAGGRVVVTVRGRENEGRAVPIAGAIVTLGSDFASTDSTGRAQLLAPGSPGRYALGATRRGLVPAFPGTVVVQ
ncbi:MAG TPA: hypothetical protein VGN13_10350 [Solirubrobacteraceae bacterium]|jgi:hypothetical protein